MRKLEYTVVDTYDLVTRGSYEYGYSADSGRDDRCGMILEVETKNGTIYIVYDEGYYRYECTRNSDGVNIIYLDDEFIEVESDTIDFHAKKFKSYEDAIESIKRIEDFGYYVVDFS